MYAHSTFYDRPAAYLHAVTLFCAVISFECEEKLSVSEKRTSHVLIIIWKHLSRCANRPRKESEQGAAQQRRARVLTWRDRYGRLAPRRFAHTYTHKHRRSTCLHFAGSPYGYHDWLAAAARLERTRTNPYYTPSPRHSNVSSRCVLCRVFPRGRDWLTLLAGGVASRAGRQWMTSFALTALFLPAAKQIAHAYTYPTRGKRGETH